MYQPYQLPGETYQPGPSSQNPCSCPPQLYHAPQQNGIVMDTLKIVREIMLCGSVNGIPPIQYVRQIKRERRDPAEIITLEDPESRPVPEDNLDKGEKKKEEKKAEDDEEENSGRVETKADKPPSKKRVSALVQKVKSDEKKKNDQKSNQQSPRN